MKTINLLTKAVLLSMIVFFGSSRASSAVTFTAVANGSWSSTVTWGGPGPGFNITAGETVVISPGVTVTLDSNLTVNGLLASVAVNGTLSGDSSLTLTDGTLSGSGTISIDDLTIGTSGLLTFSGGITVTQFVNNYPLLALAGNLSVDSTIVLNAGVVEVNSGDTVSLANNVTLDMAGGTFAVSGGILNLAGSYNLAYTGSVATIGLEALIPGLKNVTVNLSSSSSQISLSSNLTVGGTLSLQSGILSLNGNNLTIKDSVSTSVSASIKGSLSSTVTIDGSGNVGNIAFDSAAFSIGQLNLNIGGGGSVSLNSNLTVTGNLALDSGALYIGNDTLTLSGTISDSTGSLWTSVNSDIVINGSGSVGSLVISGGGNIGNLTINISAGGSVALGSDITVNGSLALSNGTLWLNGFDLTLDGTVNVSGTGSIAGDISSDITLNDSGSVGNIVLSASADSLNNLTLNVGGSSGSVSFGSNLTVEGTLALIGGTLDISGNSLTIDGTVTTDTGTVSVNSASNITVNGSGSVGNIVLKTGAQTVNNLSVDISSGGSVMFGSDVTVNGTLSLTNGTIDIGNFDLTISTSGSIQGDSSNSYIITGDSGKLVMTVDSGSVAGIFTVGTQTDFAPVVITNHSGSSGIFKVNAHPKVFANGTTGVDLSTTTSVVNTSWDVESNISSNVNVDLEMFWNTSMEVNGFDHLHAYISHYTGGAWDVTATAQATAHGSGSFSIKRTGILSFSPFAVFDENTVTGIETPVISANAEILLYPNPVRDIMNISLNKIDKESELKIFDALGNELISYSPTQTLTSLDVSHFAPGIYFISFNNASKKMFVKN